MALWVESPDLPIRVTARGVWLHGEEPLHPRVQTLFEKHVQLDEHGVYFLQLGPMRSPLVVDDTAFFVRALRIAPEQGEALDAVTLSLSDDAVETLDPTTLMQSADHALYCRVARGDWLVPCRFPPALYHELGLRARDDGERIGWLIAGRVHLPTAYDPRPVKTRAA